MVSSELRPWGRRRRHVLDVTKKMGPERAGAGITRIGRRGGQASSAGGTSD
jgi:hypothetical protein